MKTPNPTANHGIPIHAHPALREVSRHAKAFPDQEVCGIILDGKAIRGRNVVTGQATLPSGEIVSANSIRFRLDHATASKLVFGMSSGKKGVLYHSHCRADSLGDFSPEDMVHMTSKGDVPWLLADVRGANAGNKYISYKYFDPQAELAYEEREWRWSCVNCYTLVREWQRREMGVEMRPYHLSSAKAWEDEDWNMFEENLKTENFYVVARPPNIKDLEKGDIILFRIGDKAKNPNHIGVLVNPDANQMLHQLEGALSCLATYDPRRRKSTVAVYRHKG